MFFERENRNVTVHGYRENGDVTTPFDMRVVNEMDRFHLAKTVSQLVYGEKSEPFQNKMDDLLKKHHTYIREHGEDMPEVTEWEWEPLNRKQV